MPPNASPWPVSFPYTRSHREDNPSNKPITKLQSISKSQKETRIRGRINADEKNPPGSVDTDQADIKKKKQQ
jgi:hypothetical protein